MPTDPMIERAAEAMTAVQTNMHWSKEMDLLNRDHARELARAALTAALGAARVEPAQDEDDPPWDRTWLAYMDTLPDDWKGAPIDLAHQSYIAGWRARQESQPPQDAP